MCWVKKATSSAGIVCAFLFFPLLSGTTVSENTSFNAVSTALSVCSPTVFRNIFWHTCICCHCSHWICTRKKILSAFFPFGKKPPLYFIEYLHFDLVTWMWLYVHCFLPSYFNLQNIEWISFGSSLLKIWYCICGVYSHMVVSLDFFRKHQQQNAKSEWGMWSELFTGVPCCIQQSWKMKAIILLLFWEH